jgi:hypothetical protein
VVTKTPLFSDGVPRGRGAAGTDAERAREWRLGWMSIGREPWEATRTGAEPLMLPGAAGGWAGGVPGDAGSAVLVTPVPESELLHQS